MFKSLFIGTALCLSFVAPAFADGCLPEARTELETSIKAMAEGPNKVAAMKAWDDSTVAMKANKLDICDTNMKEAKDMVNKK